MLQAQINPHFLYNTLDSIKWIAVIQKNSGIVKAVTALSKLLKNMAKGGGRARYAERGTGFCP